MSDRLTQLLEMQKESPGDAFIKYGIALEYMSRKDHDSAQKHFAELKTTHPDYLPMYYQLGKVYESLNKNEDAIHTYNEGIILARNQKDMHTLNELQNAMEELL